MAVEQKIRQKLIAAFAPEQLVIENDSHKHAHHRAMAEVADRSETHFTVTIISNAFAGRSLLDRHRMINSALAEELAGPVHALSIKAATPAEVSDA